ncbi:J domain-containing protein [Halapricum hydrolyticum]|uniref:J domain-containing protein n=2 Tax=Halapricum hydrolyticum TaxID=2979991 RepID=A0AAE3LFK2_9EURY|nr:DnaJ domain-containing protein [Halapricum hydrolyticum]MCU4718576.1 J domain-containing protein [Halapricum hydrolyticum]MCU4727575.1 J domain-containing protein [Halapricum hydrolyticum]
MPEPDPDAIDYYARIGVDPEADLETIERHRKQADRRFSPMGTSPDADEKRHMRINEASNVLEDPDRRQRYDDLYESLGPINGTLAFETLSTDTTDAVRTDETLNEHLRGFIEVLGPETGAREFKRYHGRLTTPLPDDIEGADVPNGYGVDDTGFGVAAWSWHQADQLCPFSLWLTGGPQLWRTALLDSDAVDGLLAELRESGPAAVPDSETAATGSDEADETPTTQLSLGHPSSAAIDRFETDESVPSVTETASRLSAPVDRLRNVVSYVLATGGWAAVTTAGSAGGGLVGSAVAAVALVPLLAIALVVQSTAPDVSVAGVPMVDIDRPFVTVSLVHYLVVGLAGTASAWVAGRGFVPRIRERKDATLPRDAWLVFGPALPLLAGALFVGIGQSAFSRRPGLVLTAALAAFAFQAAMDVGAPRLLSLLCRGVSTLAFALASAVTSLAVIGLGLSATYPGVFEAYAAVLATLPAVESTVFGAANTELLVVSLGALAFVPLTLTSLYSLAYALESVALRVRSRAFGS